MNRERKAILGVGNVLLGDEGLGVHAIWALRQRTLPQDVELIDGGTQGIALIDTIAGFDRLVIIDCIQAGCPPGTIYRFEYEKLKTKPSRGSPTLHQAGLRDLLQLLSLLQEIPRTTFLGLEPESLEMGMRLSPSVRANLPALLDLSLSLLTQDPKAPRRVLRALHPLSRPTLVR